MIYRIPRARLSSSCRSVASPRASSPPAPPSSRIAARPSAIPLHSSHLPELLPKIPASPQLRDRRLWNPHSPLLHPGHASRAQRETASARNVPKDGNLPLVNIVVVDEPRTESIDGVLAQFCAAQREGGGEDQRSFGAGRGAEGAHVGVGASAGERRRRPWTFRAWVAWVDWGWVSGAGVRSAEVAEEVEWCWVSRGELDEEEQRTGGRRGFRLGPVRVASGVRSRGVGLE